MPAPYLHGHGRSPPHRSRCARRATLRGLRRAWRRDAGGARALRAGRSRLEFAAARGERSDRRRLLGDRFCVCRGAARCGGCLRCSDRRAALDLRSSAGCHRHRRGERVGAHGCGRRARPGVRAHRRAVARLLRCTASRQQRLRQFGGRVAPVHRRGRMGVPARAPRPVGLRHARPAGAVRMARP